LLFVGIRRGETPNICGFKDSDGRKGGYKSPREKEMGDPTLGIPIREKLNAFFDRETTA